MKHSFKQGLFPWVPLFAGLIGLAIRCWLFSAEDKQGLLPVNHMGGILSYILLALILVVCFVVLRKTPAANGYSQLFPASKVAAICTGVGAIGMGFSAFALKSAGVLRLILPILGVFGACALVFAAYCRYKGQRPSCFSHGIITLFLIFQTLASCRSWGAESQLQRYFFPLLTSLLILIASYYRAELDLDAKDCRKYAFFSQAALFCCCLCLPGEDRLFYLSAGIWLASDFCVLPTGEK